MAQFLAPPSWKAIPITGIEDLRDAVLGADLEATQLSAGELSGGIAFAERAGVVFSSGVINGRVSLAGSLSDEMIALGLGVTMPPGTRHWLHEVESCGVGVFLPGDAHDAIYPPGAIYASVALSADRLEEAAAELDLVLDRRALGGTRIHQRPAAAAACAGIRGSLVRLNAGVAAASDFEVDAVLLDLLVRHLARTPVALSGGGRPDRHGRIFARARTFIMDNLAEPLSVDAIAAAAATSRRSLYRAFAAVLDETPRAYVRRLRLHRIRHDLAGEPERACTISLVANEWGMSDLGRMARAYRELFGERPSETLAKAAEHRDPTRNA